MLDYVETRCRASCLTLVPVGSQVAELVCPTCRGKIAYEELAEIPYRPFCCLRCRMIDLGKWLNEEYRIS